MKQPAKLLIVDDEEDILLSLRFLLQQHYSSVQTEHNPYQLVRVLRNQSFDLILLDMNFRKGDTSGKDGLHWLQKVKELQPQASVIMITAYADLKTAVEAVKIGAADFVEKPWRNEKLLATVQTTLKLKQTTQAVAQLKAQNTILQSEIDQSFAEMVGQSEAMQRVFQLIEKVGKTEANVLILGENGTGKELVARAIHRASPRRAQVFVKVDLGAIPETLFESELFGHQKGAFTDAKSDRTGRFEVAAGGTLFLDEIGNLQLPMQAKLLTVLQNRSVRRLGSNAETPIDVRLISATNMPLYSMVNEQAFRQDLLYRINTVEIQLPPLRERTSDIPLLIEHFIKLYGKKYQKEQLDISAPTVQLLQGYHWPGNIRELQHTIERAVILCESNTLQAEDFVLKTSTPDIASSDTAEGPNTYKLDELEKWAIRKVLTQEQGNISKAADVLGLTRAALYRRLEKYGL
ncbi:MAG: sigma-54 dependent transcriptional regulator [Bacteroidota bacterium]